MNKTNNSVAVVVTHNRCKLLKRCIEHLQRQTATLDQILVINNASSDGTLELLYEMGLSETPSIIVFNKTDQASEECLNYASGLYPEAIFVSGLCKEGLDRLRQVITENYEKRLKSVTLELPHDRFHLVDEIRDLALVVEIKYTETNINIQLKIPPNSEKKVVELLRE